MRGREGTGNSQVPSKAGTRIEAVFSGGSALQGPTELGDCMDEMPRNAHRRQLLTPNREFQGDWMADRGQ